MMSKNGIHQTRSVKANLLESYSPQLNGHAERSVSCEGWTQPELSSYDYSTLSKAWVQDFSYLAFPPTGPHVRSMMPVKVTCYTEQEFSWLRGLRVHTSSNIREALIGSRPGDGSKEVCAKGKPMDEEVECQTLRTNKWDVGYAVGTTVASSYGDEGTTLAVDWFSKEVPKLS